MSRKLKNDEDFYDFAMLCTVFNRILSICEDLLKIATYEL